MTTLQADMRRMIERINSLLNDAELGQWADPHLDTCHAIADEFQLWEPEGDGERFPLWLSFIVAGAMRDR